jgi:hypothetical protein
MKPEPITEAEVAAIEAASAQLIALLKASEDKNLGSYMRRMFKVFKNMEDFRTA